MKKLILLSLLGLLSTLLFTQPCIPDGITFTNQQQIDNFPTNYPGCTEIQGNVKIYGGSNITNLDSLSMISLIAGDLWFRDNFELTDLTGLENLQTIEGTLTMDRTNFMFGGPFTALINLSGLNNLSSIGGSLEIIDNWNLTSIAALESLDSIGGDVTIVNNSKLNSCEIAALCDYLMDPSGIITIYDNGDSCASIIEIALSCGSTFPCLEQGNYYFTSQKDIDHFPVVFPDCSELDGYVVIMGENIKTLDSLNLITAIGGNLELYKNDSLTTLIGLSNLSSIGGNLTIGYYYYYEEPLTPDNETEWESQDYLYKNLKTDDFPHGGNDALNNLTGLDNLTSIGGTLMVEDNANLTSLAGLDNIDAASIQDLSIIENYALNTCDVWSICDYLSSPNGTTTIYNNLQGCYSKEEVEEACGIVDIARLKSPGGKLEVNYSPNPFKHSLNIHYNIHYPQQVTINFFNQYGESVDKITEWQSDGHQKLIWTPANLSSGIYYFTIKATDQVATGKVVKF